jgi:hypothetical protein
MAGAVMFAALPFDRSASPDQAEGGGELQPERCNFDRLAQKKDCECHALSPAARTVPTSRSDVRAFRFSPWP